MYDDFLEVDFTVTEQDISRFEKLFNKLDANGDGTVDLDELTKALWGSHDAEARAKVTLALT